MSYTIPLKARMDLTYHKPEDRGKAMLLAELVDMKLLEPQYVERINDILVEIAMECLRQVPIEGNKYVPHRTN